MPGLVHFARPGLPNPGHKPLDLAIQGEQMGKLINSHS